MNRENNIAVYTLLAIYLYGRWQQENPVAYAQRTLRNTKAKIVNKAKTSAANAAREASSVLDNASDLLQRGGAKVYEATHASQDQDLPGVTLTREAVYALAKEAGFPNAKLAAAIALAESGGSTGAVHRTSREHSVGLWQINISKHPFSVFDMKDPIKNAHAAFKISKGGTDWRPWTAFTNGRYKQYLTGILAP